MRSPRSPTGVDGAVRALGYSFDTGGRVYQITNYSDAAGTTVYNQVQEGYNGLGQKTAEYQEHNGAVVVASSRKIQYAFTEMTGGVNNSRPTSMTYEHGRVLNYGYNTGLDA